MKNPFNSLNNLQKEDTLDSILDVFTKTKEKLIVFISDSKEKKKFYHKKYQEFHQTLKKVKKLYEN